MRRCVQTFDWYCICICVCGYVYVCVTNLIRAEQGPAELPCLWGDLGLHQPFLCQVFVLYVGVVV